MKVELAFCLNCGWITQDLDELDAHTAADCQGTPQPKVREVPCDYCRALPGEPCESWRGNPFRHGSEHVARWNTRRKLSHPTVTVEP